MQIIPNSETLENEKSARKFFLYKYIIECIFLVLILIAIGLARFLDFVDNCVFGTLIGTTIGYFASDIRKIHT